jgi:hypothetical protein
MQAYIQAAEQLKDDIAEEFIRENPKIPREKMFETCPNGALIFDNIEIVFKNSAKYKLFSQRVQGKLSSILQGDDLLYEYLSTNDNESYNDCLESAKCCKKLSYFLFTSKYDKYTLTERNKYTDVLHKYERRLPDRAVKLYNMKKGLLDLMVEDKPTYNKVHPLVVKYIGYLKDILESQSKIYNIELHLAMFFKTYITDHLIPEFSSASFKMEPARIKALVQSLKELKERGLEFDEVKDKINIAILNSLDSVLTEHVDCLKAEVQTINEVTSFLEDIIKYADPPSNIANENGETTDSGLMTNIRDRITSSFADWLNS